VLVANRYFQLANRAIVRQYLTVSSVIEYADSEAFDNVLEAAARRSNANHYDPNPIHQTRLGMSS
jgi:hypothetical protein